MRTRPLLCLGVSALVAQIAALVMPSAACFLLAAFCVMLFFVLLVWKKAFPLCITATVAMVFFCHGWTKFYVVEPLQSLSLDYEKTTFLIEEVSAGYSPETQHATGQIVQHPQEWLKGYRAQIVVPAGMIPGEIIEGEMQFSLPPADKFAFFKQADGIFLEGETGDIVVVNSTSTPQIFFQEIKESLSASITRYLNPEVGSVAAAICIGNKSALSSETKEVFQKAGLSHVLVVSGLHLSIWCGIWAALLGRLRFRKIGIVVGILLSILFAMITGFSPSMIRALTGAIIYSLCQLFLRKADGLNSLGFAVLVLVLTNPFVCMDASFWLSISATAGVLFSDIALHRLKVREKQAWGYPLKHKEALFLKALQVVSPCFFASLATLPVLVLLESEIAIFSILSNLATGFLLLPLLIFGWICIFMGQFLTGSFFHQMAAFFVGILAKWLIQIANYFADLPNAVVTIQGMYPFLVILILAILWIVLWNFRRSIWMFFVTPLVVVICLVMNQMILAPTVTLVLIGSRDNPCVVAYHQKEAVVFFRGNSSNQQDVKEFLNQHHLRVELLVDMRANAKALPAVDQEKSIEISQIPIEGEKVFALNDTMTIALYPQKQAALALAEVYDLTVAIPYGKGYWWELPKVTFAVPTKSQPRGIEAEWFLSKEAHSWLQENSVVGEQPAVRIWPGRGIRLEGNLK